MPNILPLYEKNENTQNSGVPVPIPDPTYEPFRWLISGGTGSGKGTVTLNCIMRYWRDEEGKSLFDEIHIWARSALQDKNWRILTTDPQIMEVTTLKDEIDENEILDIINSTDTESRKLILIDDFAGDGKKRFSSKVMTDLWFRSRHANVSVIVSTQYLFKIPTDIRINCSHYSVFSITNKFIIPCVTQDLASDVDNIVFKSMLEGSTRDKHGFLHVDMYSSPRRWFSSFKSELFPKINKEKMVREQETEEDEEEKDNKSNNFYDM
jgi:hypothetical protein